MSQHHLTESQDKTQQRIAPRKTRLASAQSFPGGPHPILQLQRVLGNRRVALLIQAQRLTPDAKMIGLQRKLTVGAADGPYEQEAERVARHVLNTSDAVAAHSMQRAMSPEEDNDPMLQTKPLAASITPFVQRQMGHNAASEDQEPLVQAKVFTGTSQAPLQRQPETEEEEPEPLQAKSAGSLSDSFEAGADVETQLSQSQGRGSPLPDAVRAYMEPRFGADFSQVRTHTGSDALQMNQAVGAQAFTHGSDIYFGEGHSPSNLALTAHELTHVVQQTGEAPLQTKKQEQPLAPLALSHLSNGVVLHAPKASTPCPTCAANQEEMLQRQAYQEGGTPSERGKGPLNFLSTRGMSRIGRRGDEGAGGTAEGGEAGAVPGKRTQIKQLGSAGGAPLPAPLQERFGASPGTDLGAVRVHDGAASDAAASAMGAQAFATGDDIHFAASQYDPNGAAGQELLAHEVVHTVQQRQGGSATQLRSAVSQPGDAAEVEADRLAPAVVAGAPVQVRAAPTADVHRRDKKDHDAKHDKPKAPDAKEGAWISPSTALATDPAHVGAVFFHTKEHVLDDQDLAALTKLAKAYAPWAKRNIGKHGADLGLKGSVIGHADPRPSVEPDNQKLSEQRAFWTMHHLTNALASETGLAVGYFDISWKGEGATKGDVPAGPALEDPLPHERRADIYLDGQATDAGGTSADKPAPSAPPDPDVVPPKIKGWDDNGWDRWEPEIRNGNKGIIRDLALQMIGVLATDPVGEAVFYAPMASTFAKHGIPAIERVKPPWWEGRDGQIDIGHGRGGAAQKGLVFKALLLKRDLKETMFYEETEFSAKGGAYLTLIEEAKKDTPDMAKVAEARKKVGYLLFMLDAVGDEATEVKRLADE
jgi:Domain of unknown function (DUF4157)